MRILVTCSVLLAALGMAPLSAGENSTREPQLAAIPDAPACFLGAPVLGDPSKGASIIKMKGSAECKVPLHWHPSTENIMMISGSARTQVKDEKPVALHPGDFLSVPPKHVMTFACVGECTLFVHTDGPFSIHYVDGNGKEITPAEALAEK